MSQYIIETIKKIELARTKLKESLLENEVASRPKLQDTSIIPYIYQIYGRLNKNTQSSHARSVFTFVVIYLYAPARFFGGKMPNGLRRAIGRATSSSYTGISNNCTRLKLLYTTYKDFRSEVDLLLGMVISEFGLSV